MLNISLKQFKINHKKKLNQIHSQFKSVSLFFLSLIENNILIDHENIFILQKGAAYKLRQGILIPTSLGCSDIYFHIPPG